MSSFCRRGFLHRYVHEPIATGGSRWAPSISTKPKLFVSRTSLALDQLLDVERARSVYKKQFVCKRDESAVSAKLSGR